MSMPRPSSESTSSHADDDSEVSDDRHYKMAFVVRKDLGMANGKIIAQCCHAAVDLYIMAAEKHLDIIEQWLERGATKVALRIGSEKEM